MTNDFSINNYRPAKTFSYLTIGLFGGLVGCYALMFILSLVQTVFTIPEINLSDGGTMPLTFMFIGLIALLEILLRVLTIIFFLIWLHRAYSNLSALRAANLEFTPGWAVGWWFIPFANLVKPFQVMRELWNASDANFDADGFLSNQFSAPPIIGWWWGLMIAGNIIGRVADKMAEVNLNYSVVLIMIYTALLAIAAFLILNIVRRITNEQEAKFQKLVQIGQFAPPAPPTFDGK